MYDNKKIKKQIIAEADLYVKFGPCKIWSFILLEVFHNDVDAAKEFMLSPVGGGYTENQLRRIITEKNRLNESYKQKLSCVPEAF